MNQLKISDAPSGNGHIFMHPLPQKKWTPKCFVHPLPNYFAPHNQTFPRSLFVGSYTMLDIRMQENLDTRVWKTVNKSMKFKTHKYNVEFISGQMFDIETNKNCLFFNLSLRFLNKAEVYVYAYDTKLRKKAVQKAKLAESQECAGVV